MGRSPGTAVLVARLNNLIKLQQWLNLRIPISSPETLELQLLSRCNVRPFAKTDSSCLKGRACKIVEMSTSKTGKHGHAKVHLVGIDIFNGKKLEDICPSTHNMDVPVVKREDYTLVDIIEGYLTLMSDNGDLREDLKCPDGDIGNQIKTDFENGCELLCTVLKACGEESVIACKANISGDK